MPHLFALTSWGHAGVPWIVKCLNLHPGFRAFMNIRGQLQDIAKAAALDAVPYLLQLERVSLDGSAGEPLYEAIGDVNGVSPHEFLAISAALPDRFSGANLIGHPIARLAGSLAYSKAVDRHFTHSKFLSLWGMAADNELARSLYAILGENGDHVPAHYMMHVNAIQYLLDSAPCFHIERLMNGDDEWARLTRYLSGNAIADFGATWRSLEGQTVGVAHNAFAVGPLAAWASFADPVKRTIATMLSPSVRAAYERLGFDLSFVK
jgi:hypothetical protein